PREFDVDEALEAAMDAFWAKGYEATSLTDLMAATGLHKGSLYQAFGDKHSLFLESLKRYLSQMRQTEHAEFAKADTPAEGLRRVAHSLVDLVDDDSDPPRGCMAVNALVEMAPHDPDVQAILSDHVGRMRATIEEAIAQAQADGDIDDSRPPSLLAGMLMTFVSGLGTTM
ncbi:MAG: TetR family transcriptional regulator, partial [Gammaproteobacteria bacterium]|nr:TetR family transcriptional regulator [Gammaproteobacteria bacterium]